MLSIFFITFLINFIIFFKLDMLSDVYGVYDLPDKKLKLHKKKTPLIGGLIFFINLIFIIPFFFVYNEKITIENQEILSFALIILSFFLLGYFDDKKNIKPEIKLFLTALIVLFSILINKNLIVSDFSLTFYEHRIFLNNTSIFFTILCFVILINSLNFFDGINGQSIINFLIIFLFLFFQSNFNLMYLLIVFVLFFLLYLNLLDRIFLGDCGIYLISGILAICLIYEHNISQNIKYADNILIILFLPLLDFTRLTVQRFINRKNIFYGDRTHIHHLLINSQSLTASNIIIAMIVLLPIGIYFIFGVKFLYLMIFYILIYILIIKLLNKK